MSRNIYVAKDKTGVYLFYGKPTFMGTMHCIKRGTELIFKVKAKNFKSLEIGEIKKVDLQVSFDHKVVNAIPKLD